MNFDEPKDQFSRNRPGGFRPPRPMVGPYGRNVAILILLGSFLLITGIVYYSIQSYFWYQQGLKPVLQTGGQQASQTPIELPSLKTTVTPATVTATLPASPVRTSAPTDTKRPHQPSPEPSVTPLASLTPSPSATSNGTPAATTSPTTTASGSTTPTTSPTQSDKVTQTPTLTPLPTISPTPTE